MDLSSSTLKSRAKQSLSGNYWTAFAACLILTLITSVISGAGAGAAISSFVPQMERMLNGDLSSIGGDLNVTFNVSPLSSLSSIAVMLITAPLTVGLAKFFLDLADRRGADVGTLFGEFKHYANTLVLSVLTGLFTILWSLLFIIPGIIAALGYAMAPYIIAEHPEIKAYDAIKMSKTMMKGNKGKLFMLELSFIGWYLLCVLTFGIGFFFLNPYIHAAKAEFFNEVSGKNYQKSIEYTAPDNGAATAPAQDPEW